MPRRFSESMTVQELLSAVHELGVEVQSGDDIRSVIQTEVKNINRSDFFIIDSAASVQNKLIDISGSILSNESGITDGTQITVLFVYGAPEGVTLSITTPSVNIPVYNYGSNSSYPAITPNMVFRLKYDNSDQSAPCWRVMWTSEKELPNTGIVSGSYGPLANSSLNFGDTFTVPKITADSKGRLTAAANQTYTLPAKPIIESSDLPSSGVTAGSYGPNANVAPNFGETFTVPQITVDTKGRVTAASVRTITIPTAETMAETVESITSSMALDFGNTIHVTNEFPIIAMHNSELVKGTIPEASHWLSFVFGDSSGSTENQDRSAVFESCVDKNGTSSLIFKAYKWETATDITTTLGVYYPLTGGPYAIAPTPPNAADNSTKIATTAWVTTFVANYNTADPSDERIKTDIVPVSNDLLNAWEHVNFYQFKIKTDNQDKVHNGVIAQRVEQALADKDIDANQFAFFRHDTWDAEQDKEAGDSYSIKYTEALCIEAAYMRKRLAEEVAYRKQLEDRVNHLEQQLALVLSKM